jgi:hypothetical protein
MNLSLRRRADRPIQIWQADHIQLTGCMGRRRLASTDARKPGEPRRTPPHSSEEPDRATRRHPLSGQRYLSPTLAPLVGQTITIRYDPRDISEIRVYDRDTFVCVAIDEDHPNLRLSLRDIEAARRARRRELRRTTTTAFHQSPAVKNRIPLNQYGGGGCASTKRKSDETQPSSSLRNTDASLSSPTQSERNEQ